MKHIELKLGAVGFLLAVMLAGAAIMGWSINVIKLIGTDFEAPYKAEIIRSAGIVVFPIGAVAGYFDIGK